MAKTKNELEELKNEYTSLKSKLNELTDEELKTVSGGSYENIIVACSYQCPICGGTHKFNMEFYGIMRGFDIISYNACPKTKEVIKIKGGDYSAIRITSTDNVDYVVGYKEEGFAQ